MTRLLEPYRGMRSFLILWVGQSVSLLGGGMTRFAFVFFAFEASGSATKVTLVALASFLPKMLLSPVAGSWVDRFGDKAALVVADFGGAAVISSAAVLYFAGGFHLWYLYIIAALSGACEALQYPAFSSALPQLVSKHQLARADGLLSAARSGSDLAGPVLAGVVVALSSGLGVIFAIDAVTSVVAVLTILLVAIPRRQDDGERGAGEFWRNSLFGVRWIRQTEGLRELAGLFFIVNLVGVLGQVILQPMVLARTGGDSYSLAFVLGAVGSGGIIGGLAVSAWGGPKNKMRGVLVGVVAVSVLGQILLGLVDNLAVWCVAGFLNGAIVIVINACNQVIWQTTVPEALLGRVFGGFIFIAQISVPIAIVLAGPLADKVLQPWTRSSTFAAGLVGSGAGSGMALLLVLAGVLGLVCGLAGMRNGALRRVGERTQRAVEG